MNVMACDLGSHLGAAAFASPGLAAWSGAADAQFFGTVLLGAGMIFLLVTIAGRRDPSDD